MKLLDDIIRAYEQAPGLAHLLESSLVEESFPEGMAALERVCATGSRMQIPLPAFESTRLYFLQYTRPRSTANIIQGLRNIFGGHTYGRVDRPGKFTIRWEDTGEEVEV